MWLVIFQAAVAITLSFLLLKTAAHWWLLVHLPSRIL